MKGVIFDLDGTVVENSYDWKAIRKDLGAGGESILEYIDGLDEPERSKKRKVLEKHEAVQTEVSVLRTGMGELITFLSRRMVLTALVTNNSLINTNRLIKRFHLEFNDVLTRESGFWKPSGAPFFEILSRWKLPPYEVMAVGDSVFDVFAASAAGITGIYVMKEIGPVLPGGTEVHTVTSALELIDIFRKELG